MTPGPALRTTRAAIFAVVCVVMAALGHAVMSGGAVSWQMLGAAFLATASAAWWLGGRQRGGAVVTGATVGAQLVLHLLFHFSQSVPLPRASMAHGAHGGAGGMSGGHGAHGTQGMSGMEGMAGMADAHLASAAGGITPGMLLAHALAALVCGLWLWRGEAAAFRLGRTLAAAVYVPLRLLGADALPLPARRRPARPGAGRALRAALLHYVVARRGPPASPVPI
ncbi:hypothetical protein [Streptomyces sp. NPDC059850]|uniref:hypothetical protein n=1 Tax=Streptomyces sp. NPDC059850 TaxID=3346970 RepID=UPI003653A2D3